LLSRTSIAVAFAVAVLPGVALSQTRSAYAQHLIDAQSWPMLAPSVKAPKAERDRFDAATDRLIFGPSANWAEEHYPVNVVETKMAGVPVGIITRKNGIDPRNQHRVLINLHGGGFTMGSGLAAV